MFDEEGDCGSSAAESIAVLGSVLGIGGFVVGLIIGVLSSAVITYKITRYYKCHTHNTELY